MEPGARSRRCTYPRRGHRGRARGHRPHRRRTAARGHSARALLPGGHNPRRTQHRPRADQGLNRLAQPGSPDGLLLQRTSMRRDTRRDPHAPRKRLPSRVDPATTAGAYTTGSHWVSPSRCRPDLVYPAEERARGCYSPTSTHHGGSRPLWKMRPYPAARIGGHRRRPCGIEPGCLRQLTPSSTIQRTRHYAGRTRGLRRCAGACGATRPTSRHSSRYPHGPRHGTGGTPAISLNQVVTQPSGTATLRFHTRGGRSRRSIWFR